mgnify:CR=1 FL=1
MGQSIIKIGSTGESVIFLQQSLTKLGYKPGPIDGIFGSKTEAAVKLFQKAKGLVVDGIVGVNTWNAIYKAMVLKSGSTGEVVIFLQQSLAAIGYNPGPIDGIFGPKTEAAVKLFQKAKGLVVDGIVGGSTWTAIYNALELIANVDVSILGNKVVAYSKKFIGVPYLYGGTTPAGFDCSGFVQYVYAHNGAYQVKLPRETYAQIKVGTPISKADLQPGDLVFFGSISSPSHDGIYIGSNQFIESPHTGANVRVSMLNTRKDFCAARRIIK